MRALVNVAVVFTLLFWVPLVSAQDLSGVSPDEQDRQGEIHYVHAAEGTIVINDQEMVPAMDLKINGQSVSGAAALSILRQGQHLKSFVAERDDKTGVVYLLEVTTL